MTKLKHAPQIQMRIEAASKGFSIYLKIPGGVSANLNFKTWDECFHQYEVLDTFIKGVIRCTYTLAPLPTCKGCKSEEVWHKAMSGVWTRLCMECDHKTHGDENL